jgi:hypothetical protein
MQQCPAGNTDAQAAQAMGLLAAHESEPLKEWRKVTLNAEDLSKSISRDPEKLEFTIEGVVFKPFYDTYGRHSAYLDVTLQ